jgi:hypothetical protein
MTGLLPGRSDRMSLFGKLPIVNVIWNLIDGLLKSEGETIVEAELAKHASAGDLDELARIVAAAQALKGAAQ